MWIVHSSICQFLKFECVGAKLLKILKRVKLHVHVLIVVRLSEFTVVQQTRPPHFMVVDNYAIINFPCQLAYFAAHHHLLVILSALSY